MVQIIEKAGHKIVYKALIHFCNYILYVSVARSMLTSWLNLEVLRLCISIGDGTTGNFLSRFFPVFFRQYMLLLE